MYEAHSIKQCKDYIMGKPRIVKTKATPNLYNHLTQLKYSAQVRIKGSLSLWAHSTFRSQATAKNSPVTCQLVSTRAFLFGKESYSRSLGMNEERVTLVTAFELWWWVEISTATVQQKVPPLSLAIPMQVRVPADSILCARLKAKQPSAFQTTEI